MGLTENCLGLTENCLGLTENCLGLTRFETEGIIKKKKA